MGQREGVRTGNWSVFPEQSSTILNNAGATILGILRIASSFCDSLMAHADMAVEGLLKACPSLARDMAVQVPAGTSGASPRVSGRNRDNQDSPRARRVYEVYGLPHLRGALAPAAARCRGYFAEKYPRARGYLLQP